MERREQGSEGGAGEEKEKDGEWMLKGGRGWEVDRVQERDKKKKKKRGSGGRDRNEQNSLSRNDCGHEDAYEYGGGEDELLPGGSIKDLKVPSSS